MTNKMALKKIKSNNKKKKPNLAFERLMAILAVSNLLFVFFDLTYISFRNFWLQGNLVIFNKKIKILPISPTPIYDWVKGIEENRYTEEYLEKVDQFQAEFAELQKDNSLNSALSQLEGQLETLGELSIDMIDTNPFEVAEKTGTLEKIKNKMRLHIFDNLDASSKESFRTFWSKEYLIDNGDEKLEFF